MTLTPPRLVVQTREIDHIEDLLPFTSPSDPTAWIRRGDGMVGYGDAYSFTYGGPDGHASLAEAWQQLAAAAVIDDPLQLPGTGLVAFGALTFDPRSARQSVLTVPHIVVGRRGGRSWVTTIGPEGGTPAEPVETPYGVHWSGTVGPGAQSPDGYMTAVRAGLDAIAAGEVEKVVLARDLRGTVPIGSDLRRLARALASEYPDTWMFAVDGLIGASPETLVTVHGGTVTARVLAGTTPRGADADSDTAAAAALASSTKDIDEHEYAVQSVLASLRPHTRALVASEAPFTLKLPNVWHLATDVEGELGGVASALDLVAALHPTAAVAGTPTAAAIEVIHRLEPFDRGRYAGPVGWIDSRGDGEWAIALRCAQFDPHIVPAGGSDDIPVTAYAGAGIVADSDPETELIETRVKFRPIVDALA
ncbi:MULTISPECIES: isochorismate synthase [unclassified Microbacterium]|uniref:isochorismate synthase n=1 Tax=Microbacterium sp. zg-B96 TaxID=3049069 RepID=UPI00214CD556|nr:MULTISPECIES: isochorismate synthase [unclassified Microbacterium]MCR2783736.1 isochorismate synthase [Microbacterium sp. zg.B96]WIM15411.1 isochorismate synthase [Microbacterium sp. zg-B96]